MATAKAQLANGNARSLGLVSAGASTQPEMTARGKETPGRFGIYGGRYAPETLMAALEELEGAYEKAKRDRKFQRRLDQLLRTYAGRPRRCFSPAV